MFKRKLLALKFNDPENSFTDENDFRNLVSWIEDQKIRFYPMEERNALRDRESPSWSEALDKYLVQLNCPFPSSDRNAVIDWLLGRAVRLEYGDNVDKYKDISFKSDTMSKSTNPVDNLNFDDPDFKAGVASLAQLLQIPPYPDHLVVLKAINCLIKEKLSKEAVTKAKQQNSYKCSQYSLDKVELGFDAPNYISQEAAKILRLLHVHELRELQNLANEVIVKMQALTANPKTDTKLGKVGI